jgi:glutamate N-acetyltransferase/amino-acid N-acetyltransferase
VHCGIKSERPDLALVVADGPVAAAGMFTQNKTRSAPVIQSEARLKSGRARAVVVNSGNSNAMTGRRGAEDALAMAEAAAAALGCPVEQILVASTGVIGRPLPIDKIRAGMPAAVAALGADGMAAANAIMTTDAFPKTAAVTIEAGDGLVTIGGIAKGAGMIHPNMATMIAVMTTDAAIEPPALRQALRAAVGASFNCISVDGDTSTSDTVIALASAASGTAPIQPGTPRFDTFVAGLTDVAQRLAKLIVKDGEGATRLIEVRIRGARNDAEARMAANAVMTSMLVKTMFYGSELNWGRVTAAAGRSGAEVDTDRMQLWIGEVGVVRDGVGVPATYRQAEALLKAEEIVMTLDLGLGQGAFTGWTNDLGESYVKINSGYLT